MGTPLLEQVGEGTPATGGVRQEQGVRPRREDWYARLLEPVDIASVVFFRIAFGAILLWEVYRYFKNGWIRTYWIDPDFFFTYYGFGWVSPLPGEGMLVLFVALGALAACMMVGLAYRISAAIFFLGFSYVFLLDKTNYLNHFYLIALLGLLLAIVPAHRAFSVDAALAPSIRSATAPAWALYALRFQIGLVYFFGGVAKLNPDWFAGEPIRQWLTQSVDPSRVTDNLVWFFVYGGIALDFLAVPLLLWRRTRPYAFAAVVGFHLTNSQWFEIGIFPWFMIAATTLFFDPDWPRRLLRAAKDRWRGHGWTAKAGGSTIDGGERPPPRTRIAARPLQRVGIVALALFFAVQVLVPLRHYLYPGNVNWTEEGHRFSWHMKVRDKDSRDAQFFVTDPASGRTFEVDPDDYLTSRQADEMTEHPDMLLQFSHHLADELRPPGGPRPEVRTAARVSLNGRPFVPMIDPDVDLAAEKHTLGRADWIRPLREPLP